MPLEASLDPYPAYELRLGRPSSHPSSPQTETPEEELDGLIDREQ